MNNPATLTMTTARRTPADVLLKWFIAFRALASLCRPSSPEERHAIKCKDRICTVFGERYLSLKEELERFDDKD